MLVMAIDVRTLFYFTVIDPGGDTSHSWPGLGSSAWILGLGCNTCLVGILSHWAGLGLDLY